MIRNIVICHTLELYILINREETTVEKEIKRIWSVFSSDRCIAGRMCMDIHNE